MKLLCCLIIYLDLISIFGLIVIIAVEINSHHEILFNVIVELRMSLIKKY